MNLSKRHSIKRNLIKKSIKRRPLEEINFSQKKVSILMVVLSNTERKHYGNDLWVCPYINKKAEFGKTD